MAIFRLRIIWIVKKSKWKATLLALTRLIILVQFLVAYFQLIKLVFQSCNDVVNGVFEYEALADAFLNLRNLALPLSNTFALPITRISEWW
jgi:hypothetical protein